MRWIYVASCKSSIYSELKPNAPDFFFCQEFDYCLSVFWVIIKIESIRDLLFTPLFMWTSTSLVSLTHVWKRIKCGRVVLWLAHSEKWWPWMCVVPFHVFFFSAYLTVICVELYLLETLLFHNELYMLTAYMLIAKENVFIRTLLNSLE